MSEAANVLSSMQTTQSALATIYTAMMLTDYQYPPSCTPADGSDWDFIIVGGGSAGSVLASRLSEDSSINVLLLEAGGYAPVESDYPGTFPMLVESQHDYNFGADNDNYTGQYLQDSIMKLTQGKMLGGSSGLQHMMYEQPCEYDLKQWADISGDDAWNYTNMLPYFKKMEQLYDTAILNSTSAKYHGTTGYMKIARQSSSDNDDILAALAEMGYETKLDLSGEVASGYGEVLYSIADGKRQNNALAYLGPAKNRTNLCVALNTTAIKIVISNSKATGVQAVDSSGNTVTYNANKEVISSAGAINSPKLLLLSGIGDQEQLTNMGIECLSNVPVGENFQDNISSFMVYTLKKNNKTTPAANPHEFPVAATVGYVALDSEQDHPDYQTVNMMFPHESSAQLQLCGKVFKFTNDICQKFYDASKDSDVLVVVPYLLDPTSRGKISLASSDYTVAPKIQMGAYANSSDVTLMGKAMADFNRILNTTIFSGYNSTLVDVGLCSNTTTTTEYFECLAVALSSTTWHYCGSNSMGYVLNSNLTVKGIDAMRVVDSSSMPKITSSKINAAVTALAEKAADIIRTYWGIA